ncbi:MAG: TlpA disulfide reductase family protein [Chryseosolibacter sp.]
MGSVIYLPVAEELIRSERTESSMPLLSDARIKHADCSDAVREILLAFNVRFWLGHYGITPETDSIFSDFKETYHQSKYLATLNDTYDEFLALAPGKPAPEFEGLTREGKPVSVESLHGKVVYIDVWATWCRPCIEEIPSSIKLQQKLANEDGIEFLNVSVDSRRSDWEKFLDGNSYWTGTHIIIEPDKIDSLYKAYKFRGIPAYMLLDQAGNIIDLKASRPSDEELERKIRKILSDEV